MTSNKFKRYTGFSLIATALVLGLFFLATPIYAQSHTAAETITPEIAKIRQWGFMGAALAFGCGAIGAGMAIASVGAAAMGAMSEKPEIGGQALIFIALAEGLVVFGFITALMILGKI